MSASAFALGCALILFASVAVSLSSAQQILFKEDGEGLTDGQAVPGWTDCEGGPCTTTVTATTSVKKVGNVGIQVSGDNQMRSRILSTTLTGRLEVSVWMFPATDSKTNYVFRLSTPNDGAISLRINETNTWFLNTPAGHGAGSAAGGFNTKDGWALKLKSIRSGDILLVLKSTSKGGYYFDDPNEYSGNHGGLAKTDLNICVSASCEFPAPT